MESIEGIPSTTSGMNLNMRFILEHAAKAHRDQTVVSYVPEGRREFTYAEIDDRVCQLANYLDSIGVSAGDVVPIYGYNSHQYLELMYAIGGIGATAFPMNIDLPPAHERFCLDHIDKHAQLDKIFVDVSLLSTLEDNLPNPKDYEFITIHGSPVETDVPYLGSYDDVISGHPTTYDWPEVDEDTACIIMFTSGTSGKPKAMAHAHKLAWHAGIGMAAAKPYGPEDNMFMIPQFSHFGGHWLFAPTVGAKLVLPGSDYAENFADYMLDEEITVTAAVPTLMHNLVNVINERREAGADIDLEGLKVFMAGQSIPTTLLRELDELGATASQMYSLTEACQPFTFNFQKGLRKREREMDTEELYKYRSEVGGYFVPGVDFVVLNEDGEEQSRNNNGVVEGELAFRTPWAVNEYWHMPDKTAESDYNGYLKTGDLVSINEYNEVTVIGRLKSAIKTGGEWVPVGILEDKIAQHPDVDETCVVPGTHEKWGERPIAVVKPQAEASENGLEAEIREHLSRLVDKGDIEKWWIPDGFAFVDNIPTSGHGKYNRNKLIDEFGDILEA